jgi:hypothetical protein
VATIARVDGVGDSRWRTRAEVQNPDNVPQQVRLVYYAGAQQPPRTSTVTVEPGEQKRYQDLVQELFATSGSSGSLHVWAPTGVIVNTSTYNLGATGTYGQAIPALGEGDLLAPGEVGRLLNLASDASMRTNVGFTEFAGVDTQVEICLYEYGIFGGSILGCGTLTVSAWRNLQKNDVFGYLGVQGAHQGVLARVKVLAGGSVYAYASKIDNRTQDPTFILAQH